MINFSASPYEMKLIRQIVKRACAMAIQVGWTYPTMDATMDVEACHCNGNPLDLTALLVADDFNFAHDVFGIRRHLDRSNGKLLDCFVPRFSLREKKAA